MHNTETTHSATRGGLVWVSSGCWWHKLRWFVSAVGALCVGVVWLVVRFVEFGTQLGTKQMMFDPCGWWCCAKFHLGGFSSPSLWWRLVQPGPDRPISALPKGLFPLVCQRCGGGAARRAGGWGGVPEAIGLSLVGWAGVPREAVAALPFGDHPRAPTLVAPCLDVQ